MLFEVLILATEYYRSSQVLLNVAPHLKVFTQHCSQRTCWNIVDNCFSFSQPPSIICLLWTPYPPLALPCLTPPVCFRSPLHDASITSGSCVTTPPILCTSNLLSPLSVPMQGFGLKHRQFCYPPTDAARPAEFPQQFVSCVEALIDSSNPAICHHWYLGMILKSRFSPVC